MTVIGQLDLNTRLLPVNKIHFVKPPFLHPIPIDNGLSLLSSSYNEIEVSLDEYLDLMIIIMDNTI